MSDEKEIIEAYSFAAATYAMKAQEAAKRADNVEVGKARGMVRCAKAIAKRAAEIRPHAVVAQLEASAAASAAWATEARFKNHASDKELSDFKDRRLEMLTGSISATEGGDEEAKLRALLLKAQLEPDADYAARLAEAFEKSMGGDLKKLGYNKSQTNPEIVVAVLFAHSFATAGNFDAEIALAISYKADKLAEIYALAAWASTGWRGLRKVAEAGDMAMNLRTKPSAMFVIYKNQGNGVNYWMQFASLTGLFNTKETDEIINRYHQWHMNGLESGQDFNDFMFMTLLQEAAKRQSQSVEETEKIFYKALSEYSKC